jgi:hypothetical protein
MNTPCERRRDASFSAGLFVANSLRICILSLAYALFLVPPRMTRLSVKGFCYRGLLILLSRKRYATPSSTGTGGP